MIQTIPYLKKDEQAVFALRELYRRYGYLPYKMSRFEEYDLYVRNKDFLVSDQIITFADRNGKLLALKPDVTLSIIKNSPDRPGAVQKLYYNENVYRADSASRDIREIMRFWSRYCRQRPVMSAVSEAGIKLPERRNDCAKQAFRKKRFSPSMLRSVCRFVPRLLPKLQSVSQRR